MNIKRQERFYLLLFLIFTHFCVIWFASCKRDETAPEPVKNEFLSQDDYKNGTIVKYVDNGNPKNRINMVFIGDGFSSEDQSKWRTHVDNMLFGLFSRALGDPFCRYKKFFNVYRIDMISRYSGIDKVNRFTPLRGTTECADYTKGDCITDWGRTFDALGYYLARMGNPEITFREIALNSGEHIGGAHYPSKGRFVTYSSGNQYTMNIFLHETGHVAGLLADEYVNKPDEIYSGGEPSEPNVTKTLNPLKWEHWKGFVQPYTINGNATVNTYEGGKYVGRGVYRPAEQCMMNGYVNPFCAVCREKIILDFYRRVNPIDSVAVSMPYISVIVIDTSLYRTTWNVDNSLVQFTGFSLDLNKLKLGKGEHKVKISVADKILDYSFSSGYYDWVRKSQDLLKQDSVIHITVK